IDELLLVIPPSRIVICDPLSVKEPAVMSKAMLRMSHGTSVTGLVWRNPVKMTRATPKLTGTFPPAQLAALLQLSSVEVIPGAQMELVGYGTSSPLGMRAAPGLNPVKLILFRSASAGTAVTMMRSSVPLLPAVPDQLLIVSVPPA